MIHSPRFAAILDANVLYPASLRDFLLCLAEIELYKPKWTDEIQEEWIRNVLLARADLDRAKLERTKEEMNSAFPDSNITNYVELIDNLNLPDDNDKHILAAAIRGNTDVIVTFNLKDFPLDYLKRYDIEVQHPDEFILNLISLDKSKSLQALKNQVKRLKNPPQSKDQVLRTLARCGLYNSVLELKK
jgi:predicted nucleic acid-binding protein